MIERAAAGADLEIKAHPHTLRHACGYALANKGHDTRAIQGWLGHRSITSTAVYTALATNRFKAGVNRLRIFALSSPRVLTPTAASMSVLRGREQGRNQCCDPVPSDGSGRHVGKLLRQTPCLALGELGRILVAPPVKVAEGSTRRVLNAKFACRFNDLPRRRKICCHAMYPYVFPKVRCSVRRPCRLCNFEHLWAQ
jgi:hypothetical protein